MPTPTPVPGLGVDFSTAVTSITGLIDGLGLWPIILVGVVVGLAAGVIRMAKKAGK